MSPILVEPPFDDIELREEWLVPVAGGGLDCVWTSRVEVNALCHYARLCGGNIIEIGCNEGHTTAVLALNNPSRRIFAVDSRSSADAMLPEQRAEHPELIGKHARGFPNVEIIDIDSRDLVYDPLWDVRMVFIDGGHHYSQVKCDTEKAIDYLQRRDGGYIFWHDYGTDRPGWVEVIPYVNREIAPFYDVHLIRGTALAFIRVAPVLEERGRIRSKIVTLERERRLQIEQLDEAHATVERLEKELAEKQRELVQEKANLAFSNERWETLRRSWPWALMRPFREIERVQRRLRNRRTERRAEIATPERGVGETGNSGQDEPRPSQSRSDEPSQLPSSGPILRRLRQAKARGDEDRSSARK